MSISDQVARRIRRWKKGAVFTPKDFLDLGGRAAVVAYLVARWVGGGA